MFDEPTAGMSVDEVPVVLDLIRQLKASGQDHPAGGAQDGRGARAGRPHHRAAQRQLVADGEPAAVIASPVVQQAYLGAPRRPHEAGPHSTPAARSAEVLLRARPAGTQRRAHAHRRVPHPARRGPRRARGQVTMLLGRNGAGKTTTLRTIMGLWPAARAACASTARPSRGWAHADIAARHRLRAREHGHLRRPDGEGEHAAGRAQRTPPSELDARGWTGSSASSRR
jgi:hypothetical protein